MDYKNITVEIKISTLEGHRLPEEGQIVDKLIDHLYDLVIDDSAVVDIVHITKIDGQPKG